ncbi:sulfatase-like hydrolase/transferase [Phormidium pseudopriestleyi FRX01]|uniref:Sulfatase-like hydrolase/transferase n=1 Tax=Phormidium pseudopriestleyi FRX01 TaxID=1759528 RepID=A0ABS3FSP7_9CYAN|nr:sulfatase-like hydrolase/transferase [Phormidium pseudopriestleyi]MBO0350146.1 sulfatase-like hydrolase/transferase [Phormidium pseudopriestleyi FRX01]
MSIFPLPRRSPRQSDRLVPEIAKLESDPNYRSLAYQRYSYLSRGLYLEQLQRWFDCFPKEQFLILKSEDLFANPAATVRQVFNFLGLPDYQLPEYGQHQAGNYDKIDKSIKAALSEYFQPHNRQLEQYLGRTFNWDTDSQPVQNANPIQAKQELYQKLAVLSQVSPEQIRSEIAPWQTWLEISNPPKPKKPNILLLMSDQHRQDAMGCSGGWVRTPHLDRLAAEGIRFSNCITTSPICVPTRISLAIGWYPHNTGIWDNCPGTLPPDSRTWMQAIRARGDRTALFGKTHWHSQESDLRDGIPLLYAYGFDEEIEVAGPWGNTHKRSQMRDEWEAGGLWQAYKDDCAERSSCRQRVRPSPLGLEYYKDVWVARQACNYLERYISICEFGLRIYVRRPWQRSSRFLSFSVLKAMLKKLPGMKWLLLIVSDGGAVAIAKL